MSTVDVNSKTVIDRVKLTWDDYYDLAKKYYKFYGDLNIPGTFKTKNGYEEDVAGFSLGTWIKTQRRSKVNGNLTKEKIAKLDAIKMIWNVHDLKWNKMYVLAKAYYEHYANLDIPSKFKTINGYEEDADGLCLGQWIKQQRFLYSSGQLSRLTKEKIEKLNDIEMIWSLYELKWNEMYTLAKVYYEHHGHLNVPITYKTVNGYEEDAEGSSLGWWIVKQRDAYKDVRGLSKGRVKKLNDIKMIWDLNEYNWNERYALAKVYYEHYRHLNIPQSYKTLNGYEEDAEGILLGDWISYQRRLYTNHQFSSLPKERIQKLEKIGMVWRVNYTWDEICAEDNIKSLNELSDHTDFSYDQKVDEDLGGKCMVKKR